MLINTTSVYISFSKNLREEVLSALKNRDGFVVEVSDILNVIIFKTHFKEVEDISLIVGINYITNKSGDIIGF